METETAGDINQETTNKVHAISETNSLIHTIRTEISLLLKEVKQGYEESQTLLSFFTQNEMIEGLFNGKGLVSEIVQDSKDIIQEAANYFEEMRDKDNVFYTMLTDGIKNFSALEERISSIRDKSLDMELVSVNAMTVALKAGKAGRGLSYLTEQLQKLSTETFNYTEELTLTGQALVEILSDFHQTLETIRLFQRNFCQEFKDELDCSFTRYNDAVNAMSGFLFDFFKTETSIKEPLEYISELLTSTRAQEETTQHDQFQTEIDETETLEGVPSRTTEMQKITENNEQVKLVSAATKYLSILKKSLSEVEREMGVFVEFLVGTETDQSQFTAIGHAFDECAGIMRILMAKIEDSMLMKGRISEESIKIMANLKLLDEDFTAFLDVTDTIYSIDVVLRIELAKQEALEDKRESIGEMTEITNVIRKDLKNAMRTVKEITSNIGTTVRYYSEKLGREEGVVADIGLRIKQNFERLTATKEYFVDAVQHLSVFTDRFFYHLESLQNRLEDVGQVHSDAKTVDMHEKA